jgi:PAS domain S-box-containing protein
MRVSFERVLRTGAVDSMPTQRYDLRRADGTWGVRHWTPVNAPVLGPDGRVRAIIHHVEDITEQVLAREAATAIERRATDLLARMTDGHVMLDRDFRVLYLNPAAERLLGVPAHTVIGRTHWEVWPSSVDLEAGRAYRRVVATGAEEHLTQHHVGEGYDQHLDIDAYPTPDGGVAVFWRDVTARVHAAEQLAQSEARYRELAASVPVQVWTARPDGALDFVTDQTAAYFGTTPEALRGDGWTSVCHPDDLPAARARWAHALATGDPYEVEFRLRRGADGVYCWFLGRAVARRDASGAVAGWIGSNTDIEAAKFAQDVAEQARAEAEAARRAAEAANRAKGEFLAVMSHELRTPLNAIGGYAQLLELGVRGPVTEAQRADLARIQRSQRHLLGLINGVLNYARVEAGAVHYDVADVDLGEVLSACEALTAPQVRARGLVFEAAGGAGGPDARSLTVRADAEKLQQVLLNLLSNAVKFTEPGGRVRVACAPAPDGRVAITVADTGRGIAADQLARVFEPFVQVDQGLTREGGGVGLGLAISRDLARGMGGDLSAESRPGAGSVFTLTLPGGAPAA